MLHDAERLDRLAANALRRRVRRDQLRVLRLQAAQFAHQSVVLRVGDLGLVEHVIAVVVVVDLGAQFLHPELRLLGLTLVGRWVPRHRTIIANRRAKLPPLKLAAVLPIILHSSFVSRSAEAPVKKLAFVLFLSLTALLAACAAGAAKTQPRVELTGDHLKSMVLIKDDLGPAYADFNLDATSGPRTSEQLVNESDNPDDEALDVAKFGTLLAHEDTYISQQALATRSGVIFLTDAVVLYANKGGAAGDLADSVGDTKRGFSGTSKYGTLQAFKSFKPKVGDSAQGEVIRLLAPGIEHRHRGQCQRHNYCHPVQPRPPRRHGRHDALRCQGREGRGHRPRPSARQAHADGSARRATAGHQPLYAGPVSPYRPSRRPATPQGGRAALKPAVGA